MRRHSGRRIRARVATTALATVVALLLTGNASALAANLNGMMPFPGFVVITYTAAATETNDLNVALSGGNYVFLDDNNTITASGLCTGGGAPSAAASCPALEVDFLQITLDDMDDRQTSTDVTLGMFVSGGIGADELNGGGGGDFLDGGDGNDEVSGGNGGDNVNGGDGSDQLNGGAGSDTLVGDGGVAPGADEFNGGGGFDTANFFEHATDVTVTLDGVANDGSVGEGDNVKTDVEDVSGSPANDNLRGNEVFNSFFGSGGDDTIDPGGGEDLVSGDEGSDTLNTRDGFADRVSCGDGVDTANVDTLDSVADDCESINRVEIGTARDIAEDAPPTVALTSPVTGATIPSGTPTSLTATANDDRGVARVLFMDDDRVVCSDEAAPYECSYQPRGEDVGRNTLVAAAQDTAGQTAFTSSTVNVLRFNAPGLSILTRPRRDTRAPYTFTTSGKLALPPTVTPVLGCAGVVTVQIQAGRKTVSSRRVRLSRACTYRSRVTFEIPRRLDPRTLRVRAIFAGNEVVERETSRRVSVRVK